MMTLDAIADFRQALRGAAENGSITCDRLEFYESFDDLPLEVKGSIRTRLYGDDGYAVAWRDGGWAFMALAKRIVASIVCEDLAAGLDRTA
jgi:transcriptional regulator CtsR